MRRLVTLCFGAALALLASSACAADETFPVVHNDPISIRILDGRDGHPVAHARLILVAGYTQRDFQLEMWRQEALSDDHGQARLPNALANLPFLQIAVAKNHLCLANSHGNTFSVDRIRRDGLSTPNRCGTVTVEDAPGVFTVFVKGKSKSKKASERTDAAPVAPAPTPAHASAPVLASAPSPAVPRAAAPSQAIVAASAQAPASTPALTPGTPAAGAGASALPLAAAIPAPAPVAAPPAKPVPNSAPVPSFTPLPTPSPSAAPARHPGSTAARTAPPATGKPRAGTPAVSRPSAAAIRTAASSSRRAKRVALTAAQAKTAAPPDAPANNSDAVSPPAKPGASHVSLTLPSTASCPPSGKQ